MSLVNRFSTIQKGAMIFTGNTLGLSGPRMDGAQIGSIGAFITLDLTSQVPGYPDGTTLNWLENESQAQLTMSGGATVLYAELQWGGAAIATGAGDVTAFINNSIIFTTPSGQYTIAPTTVTASEFTFDASGTNQLYSRSQDVTALVLAGGTGTYSVASVPAVVAPDNAAVTAAGWTLGIVYADPALPARSMTIEAGLEGVRGSTSDITVTGFVSPVSGTPQARILMSAIEGDPGVPGDQALFGPSTGSLVNLFGPNNLAGNFFASQINDGDSESLNVGQLDTSGTFGALNSTPGSPPPQGVRQGWDITNVVATNFTTNQTQAVLRITSTGDAYAVPLVGLQLDAVLNPVTITKSVDKTVANLGEVLTYTVVVGNIDTATIVNVILQDSIPSGTTFVGGSVSANTAIIGDNPSTGITILSIDPSQSVTISWQVTVGNTIPAPNPIPNIGRLSYADFPPVLSNLVETQINHAELLDPAVFIKSVDKVYADLGEVLTYTITSTNTGSVDANNVVLTDIVPSGTSLVPGSISVDVPHSITLPEVTINLLGPVAPGSSFTVSFQVTVDTLPTPNPIPNTATLAYTYTVDPAAPDAVSASGVSNQVDTLISHADLLEPAVFIKSVDKAYANVGDILTYTITSTNTGNVDATNVVLADALPSGTSLVPGSITVDVPHSVSLPDVTVNLLGPVAPGGSFTVSFQVTVDTIPTPNPIANTATLAYNYTVDPANIDGASAVGVSNQVDTQVNHAELLDPAVFIKSVDKAYADVGEVLTYTITSTNTGNIDATNVVITDAVPNGTSLVPGSITVDVPHSITLPDVTVNLLGPVAPGASFTMSFQVTVDTIPTPNPIPNTATLAYTYTVNPADPDGVSVSVSGVSNQVDMQVNHAELLEPTVFVKSVDKAYADVGDILTYTITSTNTGNVDASNVVLTDVVPSGTSLIPGSITVDVPHSITLPDVTVNLLGPVAPGASFTVSFQVTVDTVPTPNPIPNVAELAYNYTVDLASPDGVAVSGVSNEVDTRINHGEILSANFNKAANRVVTTEADTITYTLNLQNTGNVLITVTVTDALAPGTTFVSGTVNVDGIAHPTEDPVTGIAVGVIGINGIAQVTFKVKVNDNPPDFLVNTATANYSYLVDPADPPKQVTVQSNPVSIETIVADLQLIKSVDRNIVAVGEEVTYTLQLTNTGEIDIEKAVVKDLLDPALDFVEGSVMVDGISMLNDNILTGVTLTSIAIGEVMTIIFKAKIVQKVSPFIINQATVMFTFVYAPYGQELIKKVVSNEVILEVGEAKLGIMKEASKTQVLLEDTIMYKVTLTNSGDLPLDNVVFKDQLSEAVELIPNSFTINGVLVNDVDLAAGVNLGSIGVQQVVNILYEVRVISGTCSGVLENNAYATYNYVLPNMETATGQTETASAKVAVTLSSFKQSIYTCTFKLPACKPDIVEVDDVTGGIRVIDSYVVDTLRIQSIEGQNLSGKKLIIHGVLDVVIQYEGECGLYPANKTMPISEFLILPGDYIDGETVSVTGIIEEIQIESINAREVVATVMALFVAQI